MRSHIEKWIVVLTSVTMVTALLLIALGYPISDAAIIGVLFALAVFVFASIEVGPIE